MLFYWAYAATRGDESIFHSLIAAPRTERISTNLGGILAGLTLLDSKRGWAKIAETASNPKGPFDERLAAIGTIRFFQATRPEPSRPEIISIYRTLAGQGDLADVVAEDLRRWGWWDLTAEVLAPFEQPTHKAPIVRQALVRYALTCPDAAAKTFLDSARKSDAKLVERVEEGLKQFSATPKKCLAVTRSLRSGAGRQVSGKMMYPSGSWSGFWQQEGWGRQPMQAFELQFRHDTVIGGGFDIVGSFRILGEWEPTNGAMHFVKKYVGAHRPLFRQAGRRRRHRRDVATRKQLFRLSRLIRLATESRPVKRRGRDSRNTATKMMEIVLPVTKNDAS